MICPHCGAALNEAGWHVDTDDNIRCITWRFGHPTTLVLRFDRVPPLAPPPRSTADDLPLYAGPYPHPDGCPLEDM